MANLNNKEKIHELLDLCLEIQTRGKGINGIPYVDFRTANYGEEIEIYITDHGFDSKYGYDGHYEFSFERIGGRTYGNCKRHLEDLIKKVNECTDTSALPVGTI